MRYELTDCEWFAIKPLLPNKPRGVPREMTAVSSMASSGSCAQAPLGATCPETGARILPPINAGIVLEPLHGRAAMLGGAPAR
jgi:hypothetical protein